MPGVSLKSLVGDSIIAGTGKPASLGTVVLERQGSRSPPARTHISSDATAVNCTGMVVTPGFIDSHLHVDHSPLLSEADVSEIQQGVTTEHRELRTQPGSGRTGARLGNSRTAEPNLPSLSLGWSDTDSYFGTLTDSGLAKDQAPLVGTALCASLRWVLLGGLAGAGRAEAGWRACSSPPWKRDSSSSLVWDSRVALESAALKMTGLTADIFGLADRRRLRQGCCADVVVFDPATVTDTATYTDPESRGVGIEWVYENGSLVVDNGAWLKRAAGMTLKAE